jgi:hypothetical protein
MTSEKERKGGRRWRRREEAVVAGDESRGVEQRNHDHGGRRRKQSRDSNSCGWEEGGGWIRWTGIRWARLFLRAFLSNLSKQISYFFFYLK